METLVRRVLGYLRGMSPWEFLGVSKGVGASKRDESVGVLGHVTYVRVHEHATTTTTTTTVTAVVAACAATDEPALQMAGC